MPLLYLLIENHLEEGDKIFVENNIESISRIYQT